MGAEECPRSLEFMMYLNAPFYFSFGKPRINAQKRIGPHHMDVMGLLFGAL